jgi:hypothetical protein
VYYWKLPWGLSMSGTQTRAIKNYRSRLSKRGLARFEVLGRDSDRALIRSLARRLAEDSSEASKLRAIIKRSIAGEPPRKVLPFDESAALVWARLMAEGKAEGRPRSALETIIAAVAEANSCTVVTDNDKDFADVQVLNPLKR